MSVATERMTTSPSSELVLADHPTNERMCIAHCVLGDAESGVQQRELSRLGRRDRTKFGRSDPVFLPRADRVMCCGSRVGRSDPYATLADLGVRRLFGGLR
jgi:hypothetical protein